MGRPHYRPSGYPKSREHGSSQFMRDELALIEAGMEAMNRHIVGFTWNDVGSTSRFICLPMPFPCRLYSLGFSFSKVPSPDGVQIDINKLFPSGSAQISLNSTNITSVSISNTDYQHRQHVTVIDDPLPFSIPDNQFRRNYVDDNLTECFRVDFNPTGTPVNQHLNVWLEIARTG